MGRLMLQMNRAQNRSAIRSLDMARGARVLEIGCGPGDAIRRMARHEKVSFVGGIDHSNVMVRSARGRNRASIKNGRVFVAQGDAARIPFAAHSFDLVLAINSFHQWPDRIAALKEISRILRPGGKCVFSIRIRKKDRGFETEAQGRARVAEAVVALERAGLGAIQQSERPLGRNSHVVVSARLADCGDPA